MKVRVSPFNPQTHLADKAENIRVSKESVSCLSKPPSPPYYSWKYDWLSKRSMNLDGKVIELTEIKT
jgi:hypothetical protein